MAVIPTAAQRVAYVTHLLKCREATEKLYALFRSPHLTSYVIVENQEDLRRKARFALLDLQEVITAMRLKGS